MFSTAQAYTRSVSEPLIRSDITLGIAIYLFHIVVLHDQLIDSLKPLLMQDVM